MPCGHRAIDICTREFELVSACLHMCTSVFSSSLLPFSSPSSCSWLGDWSGRCVTKQYHQGERKGNRCPYASRMGGYYDSCSFRCVAFSIMAIEESLRNHLRTFQPSTGSIELYPNQLDGREASGSFTQNLEEFVVCSRLWLQAYRG